jgi:hypothetical protein
MRWFKLKIGVLLGALLIVTLSLAATLVMRALLPPPPLSFAPARSVRCVAQSCHSFDTLNDSLAGAQSAIVQETASISIPTGVQWGAPHEFLSAWTMASRGLRLWDQIGWVWTEGNSKPIIFAQMGGSGYPSSLGPTVHPGTVLAVRLSCTLNSPIWVTQYRLHGEWHELSKVAPGVPCRPGVTWTRSTEAVESRHSAPAIPTKSIVFSAASVRRSNGSLLRLPGFSAE